MHFVVFGSGAVGGYCGARLVEQGNKVTFVARNQQLLALQQHGLTVESTSGDIYLPEVDVVANTDQTSDVDVIVVAVKSFQLDSIIPQIKKLLLANTRIIPLLNGVNAAETLSAAGIDKNYIYGGLAKIISAVKAPGIISHTGTTPHITLGVLSSSAQTEEQARLSQIADVLRQSGISVGVSRNIHIALWRKFIFVAAWGILASVCRVSIGKLRSNTPTKGLLAQLLTEYAQIANAEQVKITEEMVNETLGFIDLLPQHSETSMQRDIYLQQTSEFDSLVAYPKRLADKYQLDTPLLNFCYACLSVQHDEDEMK